MSDGNVNFKDWAKSLDNNTVNIWREAMNQLRRLSDDVWNSLRFFLSFNGILIGAALAIFKIQKFDSNTAVVLGSLSIFGFLITLAARMILTRQRDYYNQMLLKKSLIEDELGFYQATVSGTDLSFPWKVEADDLSAIRNAASLWIREQKRRKGSITRLLFIIYETLIAFYLIGLVVLIIGFSAKWY
jgi:hypothetical protein